MNIEETIFKNSTLIPNNLLTFGFIKSDEEFVYSKIIMNNKFGVKISISFPNKVIGKIYDLQTGEEYTNYRIENFGAYSNTIREIYLTILNSIKDTCFITSHFKSNQANRLTKYIKDKFTISPEFLWEKHPRYGVFRNNNTDKWFAIILNVDKSKLVKDETGEVEIIDIKVTEDVSALLKMPGFYPAYHMNKKSWITIILDDTLKDSEIISLLDNSYELSPAPNAWVIPANPKYYNIIEYFKENDTIMWHQTIKANDNDIVYIYMTEPYAAIMYKCRVIKANLPVSNTKKEMKLKLEEQYSQDQYPISIIKACGVAAIRSERAITNKLKDLLERKI